MASHCTATAALVPVRSRHLVRDGALQGGAAGCFRVSVCLTDGSLATRCIFLLNFLQFGFIVSSDTFLITFDSLRVAICS